MERLGDPCLPALGCPYASVHSRRQPIDGNAGRRERLQAYRERLASIHSTITDIAGPRTLKASTTTSSITCSKWPSSVHARTADGTSYSLRSRANLRSKSYLYDGKAVVPNCFAGYTCQAGGRRATTCCRSFSRYCAQRVQSTTARSGPPCGHQGSRSRTSAQSPMTSDSPVRSLCPSRTLNSARSSGSSTRLDRRIRRYIRRQGEADLRCWRSRRRPSSTKPSRARSMFGTGSKPYRGLQGLRAWSGWGRCHSTGRCSGSRDMAERVRVVIQTIGGLSNTSRAED